MLNMRDDLPDTSQKRQRTSHSYEMARSREAFMLAWECTVVSQYAIHRYFNCRSHCRKYHFNDEGYEISIVGPNDHRLTSLGLSEITAFTEND
jgi:hypothetical protein